MTIDTHNRVLLILVTVSLFSFLGAGFNFFVYEWDLTQRSNINVSQIVFWTVGVWCAIALAIAPKKPLKTPPDVILWLGGIVVLSIILLPALDYPMASIIGTPLSNMGLIQNLVGCIVAYAVYVSCTNNTLAHGIIIGGTVASLAMFLTLGMISETINPDTGQIYNAYASWFDIYALTALPCLIIIVSGFYHANKKIHALSLMGVLLVLFSIWRSDNMSAQVLVLLAPIFWGGIWGINKLLPNQAMVIKAILLPLSIVFITVFISLLIHIVDYSNGLGNLQKWETIFQRSLLFNTYFVALGDSIAPLFTGFGWGESRNLQFLYEPLLYALHDAQNITYRVGENRHIIAGGLGGASIHNILLDQMIAIGIFGGMAFLTMLYHLGKRCHKAPLVLVAWILLIGLYSVWFPTSNSIAPFFVAIGLTCALPSLQGQTDTPCPFAEKAMPFYKPVLALSAVVMALGTFYSAKQVSLLSNSYKMQSINPALYEDSIFNQDHTNYVASHMFFRNAIAQGLNKMIQGEQIQSQEALIIVQGVDLYKKKSDDGNTIMTLELLHTLNIIMTQGADKDMAPARKRYFADWEPALKTAVQRAKYRFDLWKPYFQFMANAGQWQAVGNMAQWILENGNPNDPTAYFFRGIAYQQLGDVATGNADINTALSHGITAIIFNASDYIKK